ncbi:hypothetical protein IC582_026374 [Cucumis melo]
MGLPERLKIFIKKPENGKRSRLGFLFDVYIYSIYCFSFVTFVFFSNSTFFLSFRFPARFMAFCYYYHYYFNVFYFLILSQ